MASPELSDPQNIRPTNKQMKTIGEKRSN